jgi:hypothetical protein
MVLKKFQEESLKGKGKIYSLPKPFISKGPSRSGFKVFLKLKGFIKVYSNPEMFICKGMARPGFEVSLKCLSLV